MGGLKTSAVFYNFDTGRDKQVLNEATQSQPGLNDSLKTEGQSGQIEGLLKSDQGANLKCDGSGRPWSNYPSFSTQSPDKL